MKRDLLPLAALAVAVGLAAPLPKPKPYPWAMVIVVYFMPGRALESMAIEGRYHTAAECLKNRPLQGLMTIGHWTSVQRYFCTRHVRKFAKLIEKQ